jgi:dihydrofolate reductase
VRELVVRSDGVFAIMGSGALIASLMAADLIDEYLLMIQPLILGTGTRLFAQSSPVHLELASDVVTTSAGMLIATYEPVRGSGRAPSGEVSRLRGRPVS